MPFLRSWTLFTPWLVNFHHGLSRAVSCSCYAVIFTRSRSCRLCWDRIWEPDCAVTRAQIIGTDTRLIWDAEYAIPSSLEVDFGNSNLESRNDLMPVQCVNNTPTTSPCKHKRDTGTGKQETHRGRELPGGSTWGMKTSWGIAVISCDSPSLGVTRRLFGLYWLQKLRRVILGPRSILIMYCLSLVCTLYSVMSQH